MVSFGQFSSFNQPIKDVLTMFLASHAFVTVQKRQMRNQMKKNPATVLPEYRHVPLTQR